MKPNDIDMVEVVDHRADRPESTDRGGRPIPLTPPDDDVDETVLFAEAGMEPIFSTSEAAEFFDRSNQWLYWGLREQVFTHDDGTPIELAPHEGRRRFTLPIIQDILMSSYRRGNMSQDQFKTVMRRIKFAQRGVEWREREGWKYAHMGKNRHRWAHPNECVKRAGEWRIDPKAKKKR